MNSQLFPTVRLSRLVIGIKDGTHGTFERVSTDGVPLLSAKNVRNDRISLGEDESLISYSDSIEIVKNGYPSENDILLTIVGSLGRSAVYNFHKPIAFQRSVAFIRPNLQILLPKFLKYCFDALPVQEQLNLKAKTSAQPGVYLSDVMSCMIPLTSLPLQTQIVEYLDHETAEIDAFIMDLDSFISLLHESLGAIRSELFGQPTTHEAISLKRLARQVSGSGFPHDYQGDPAQEIPFFKVGSLKDSVDGKLTDSPNTVSTSTAKALGAMIFPENTVVLAKIGAALFSNRTARLGKPSCIDNNMLGLIPHPGVNPEFLQGIISNMDLVPLGNPGAVPSLNMAWYREQPAWLPSYTNQQEIVETYRGKKDDISSLITGAHRAIDLARERRAALITAAVTGQIDVTAKNKPAAEQIEDDVAQGLHREYA